MALIISRPSLSPRLHTYVIVDCAYRNLKLAFFRKYARDLPIRPPTPTHLVDQFTVRLQAGARRFLRQAIEDIPKLVVHRATFGVSNLNSV